MNPENLIAPASALGLPAAHWILVALKVLGFVLHTLLMSLWFAGLVLALGMQTLGGALPRRLSARLLRQMPVIVAFGVNFGVVPLLFTQVIDYRAFYPATILMAWSWMSVIGMLIFAYYGVYICAKGLREGRDHLAAWRLAVGWIAALLFLGIGMQFTSAFHLMTDVGSWPALWEKTEVSGAVLGTAVVHGEPAVLARWLMLFGLALTTTAAWCAVDAGVLAVRESEEYRRWASGFAFRLYLVGAVWFAVFGCWYVFGTWGPEVRGVMWGFPGILLTLLTAVIPALPLFLLFTQRGQAPTRAEGLKIGFAQVAVIAVNAVSRQIVQNVELRPFLDVTAEPVHWQTGPLIIFLLLFVAGIAVLVWMIAQLVKAWKPIERTASPPSP
jgi:hypothetical protein